MKLKKIFIFLSFVILLFFSLSTINYNDKSVMANSEIVSKKPRNFLILGRDGNDNDQYKRTDVIMIASIAENIGKINLISIPRDSLVNIPCGSNGSFYDKINHAYTYGEINWENNGGVNCIKDVIEDIFEVPPIPYVLFTFDTVKKIVDIVGGVEVIPNFNFSQMSNGKIITFKKDKKVLLDGEKTLAFIRHRMSLPNGDFDRCNNQKQVVAELLKKIASFSRLQKIKLGLQILPLLKTDINLKVLFELIQLNLQTFSINTYTLKGENYYNQGYYFKLDKKYLEKMKKILN